MSLQGPVFAPPHRDEFYSIIGERYRAARAEAAKIAAAKGIRMIIEFFKPSHFGWTDYKLPVGDTTKTLKENVAFFPVGLAYMDDAGFDYIRWYDGKKTELIGDWFVKPVYYFREKQGVYKGNLRQYEWRGAETFTFTVHSTTTPTPSYVNAWLLAFVVLPKNLQDSMITTS